MVRCVVESVRVHPETKQHTVILRDQSGAIFPINVGPDTAYAIASVLQNKKQERPMTHDLMFAAMEKLGVRVVRAAVTSFVPCTEPTQPGGLFYATLTLARGSEDFELDCRPSDAIALAVRSGASIEVDDAIFRASSMKAVN